MGAPTGVQAPAAIVVEVNAADAAGARVLSYEPMFAVPARSRRDIGNAVHDGLILTREMCKGALATEPHVGQKLARARRDEPLQAVRRGGCALRILPIDNNVACTHIFAMLLPYSAVFGAERQYHKAFFAAVAQHGDERVVGFAPVPGAAGLVVLENAIEGPWPTAASIEQEQGMLRAGRSSCRAAWIRECGRGPRTVEQTLRCSVNC